MKIQKKNMTLPEKAEMENAIAREEKNRADIDYIAMMTDVDIDEEEAEDDAQ